MATTAKKQSAEQPPAKSKAFVSESLAVKYRPKTLSELVGHSGVVQQLMGMFKTGHVPNTILLAGESGTGKTTLARMIARTVNCQNLDQTTFAPCENCMSCRYENSHPDIMEMNMADTRGIDDVRSLIAASKNSPSIGSNRVILLDESHMLTSQAAQCLLKILEEPPASTMWILATTNPEKLPGTILGRCHQFQLKKLDDAALRKRLLVISRKEGVPLKEMEGCEQILSTIVSLSNGRARDSIQLLESVIFGIRSGEAVDPKTILAKFLTTPEAELDQAAAELLVSILASDLKGTVKAIRGSGNARGVMYKLRFLLMYLIDAAVGLAKFQPWSAKQFSKLAQPREVKVSLMRLVELQNLLLEMEMRFNTLNVEESVTMLSMIGANIAAHAARSKS